MGYYTYADIHSDLILPKSGFDEFVVFDESLIDLKKRHSNLIEKMKANTVTIKKIAGIIIIIVGIFLILSSIFTKVFTGLLFPG